MTARPDPARPAPRTPRPGFIDIQVNGYAGIDFLSELVTPEQVQLVAQRLRRDGVRAVLVTITTDDLPLMAERIANFRRIVDRDPALRALMPAFHVEGPCLSPVEGYRGAHRPQWIRPAAPEVFEPLAEAAGGWERVAIVTLAPEVDPGLRTTRWLIERGVMVCIGHTDAPLDVLREAEDAGVTLWTHFGNGCAHLVDRHDNVLNRGLSLERMRVSLIPDGHHLPWFLLKAWIRHFGVERCVFTTDCVAPAGAPPGRYRIAQFEVEVGADKRVQPVGKPHLAGSALTMPEAYANAIDRLGLTEAQARALTVDQPATLLARWL